MQKSTQKENPPVSQDSFQLAVDYFIESAGKVSANMLGMVTKVGGQMYALLFLSNCPLSLDEMADRLKISKSNISINIRLLEEAKLVRKVWVKGSRKDYYEAMRDPRQFFRGFFDRLKHGIDDSIRLVNTFRNQFEKVKEEKSVEREDEIDFILQQLSSLTLFYEGASRMFESFYQGREVNINILRNIIFD